MESAPEVSPRKKSVAMENRALSPTSIDGSERPVEITPLKSLRPDAVEVDGVCRRYGRRWALIDVNLRFPRGTVTMVAGRNGSGKSTLFRVLSTAIRADRGTARVEGADLHHDRDGVRRRIALLGHYSNTYESLSALQNLEISSRFRPRPSSREELMGLLDQVGLAHRALDVVNTFSAGMRKRLSIARVLLQVGSGKHEVGDASVVMLDEPYGQLDPPGFHFVDRLFNTLRDRNVTVLLATHQIERAAAICDRAVMLAEGRVVWTGTAKDVLGQGMDLGMPEAH